MLTLSILSWLSFAPVKSECDLNRELTAWMEYQYSVFKVCVLFIFLFFCTRPKAPRQRQTSVSTSTESPQTYLRWSCWSSAVCLNARTFFLHSFCVLARKRLLCIHACAFIVLPWQIVRNSLEGEIWSISFNNLLSCDCCPLRFRVLTVEQILL